MNLIQATGTIEGNQYTIHVVDESRVQSNGYLKYFSVYMGEDDYGNAIVEPFGPFYTFDRTEIQNVMSALRTGISGVGGAVQGGTAAQAIRKGSSAMAKGAFRGGAIGIAIGLGVEVVREVARIHRIQNSQPVGYVSAGGTIITDLA